MGQNFAFGNIIRSVPVNLLTDDFTDENGFFIRATTSGYIKYCPMNNGDSEAITKYFDASEIFIDPELCRKIFIAPITSPPSYVEDVYIGYGV